MIDYCIIGSGISGSTIANLLKKKNQVAIYDKARGPGGRSSFKRFDKKIGYDHGVQYISPKTLKFKKFINKLIKLRILKKWGDFKKDARRTMMKFGGGFAPRSLI